jgi:hypothetical protein
MLQCDTFVTLEHIGSHLHRFGAIMWPKNRPGAWRAAMRRAGTSIAEARGCFRATPRPLSLIRASSEVDEEI